jgi:hypothetical protein
MPSWDFWRRHKAADDLVLDPHANKTVPGIITRLCLNHYTYKSYGAGLLDNLAPGIPDPLSLDPSLPSEVVDLLKWCNGLIDSSMTNSVIIYNYQLLTYDESCHASEALHTHWGDNDIVSALRSQTLRKFVGPYGN